MRLDYLTIFPDFFAPLELSLPGKAAESGLVDVHVHDLRAWTHDRHRTVDDTPYGGGAGMVMKPEPWGEAFDELVSTSSTTGANDRPTFVVPTPAGRPMTQALARDLATRERLIFCCGRYEGIDQRVLAHAATLGELVEVSLGDYVLNGGEVAALAITEAVVRLLPGFMGNAESLAEESHEGGLLEYPSYTKPQTWRDHEVPDVLRSGDHARIEAWRHEQAVRRTAERRPDLLPPTVLDTGDEIVPATAADAAEILTLQRASWLQEAIANDRLDVPALHEDLETVRASIDEWHAVVVRRSGRLVASARGRLDGDAWDVGRIMVAPDLQGSGLGRRLLEYVESLAPAAATSYRLITGAGSRRNHRFYKRAGYRLRRDLPALPGAVTFTKAR